MHKPGLSPEQQTVERDIAGHIFTTSSVMMGLCLTIISLMDGRNSKHLTTIVDDIVVVDALFFLTSCLVSYAALRSRHMKHRHTVETIADIIFLIGMVGVGIACVLFVWTLL